MSRVPLRVRLTGAFALAMVLVLAGAALFVYLRLKSDLDEGVTSALDVRAAAVLASGSASAAVPGDAEEGFALLATPGRPSGADRFLTAGELRRAAAGGSVLVERTIPGVEGRARVLARGDGDRVAVVGQSLDDRDETLGNLVASFAVGGPVAVILASLLGYALAAAALRPVEAMRRRAEDVSLDPDGARLPLPEAHDEIRRLGETLNAMLDRLRRSFERERRFVSDASHELRTPVAVIKAELEAALLAGGHEPQVREALVAAVEECDHLAQLAEDLLVIARATDDGLPVHPVRLEVRELFDAVAARFGARARERGRAITADVGDARHVDADRLRVLQALGNLVDNALRHGDGEIALRARRAGAGAALDVCDHGEGLDPGFAAHAFERFTRGDAARTHSGTGLGLAIVRSIASAHGGRVDAVPGPDATFRLWLPDQPAAASGSSQVAAVASRSRLTRPTRGGGTP